MNHDPSAWDVLRTSGADVAFVKNPVRPADDVLPYLVYAEGQWLDTDPMVEKERSAIVSFNHKLRVKYLRSNLALIDWFNFDSADLYYIDDGDAPELMTALIRDLQINVVVCSDDHQRMEELGLFRQHTELYSLKEAPQLQLFTKDWREYHAYEIVDLETGVQSDPQLVIASRDAHTGQFWHVRSVRESRAEFDEWLGRGEKLYARSIGSQPFIVECAHIRPGIVPTYMNQPITHWGKYVGGCPRCGEENDIRIEGEIVVLCYVCAKRQQSE